MSDAVKQVSLLIDKVSGELLEENIMRYRKAGEAAMEEIQNRIIEAWFGGYDSNSMKKAMDYKSSVISKSDTNVMIEITSYANPAKYNQNQKIQDWNERNNIGLSQAYLVEYVMDLQLNQGIIGLPEKGTREVPPDTPLNFTGHLDENNHWVNDNFIQREPLALMLDKSSLWNKWGHSVRKFSTYF